MTLYASVSCDEDRRCSILDAGSTAFLESTSMNLLPSSQVVSQSSLFSPFMALTPPLDNDMVSHPSAVSSRRPNISPLQPSTTSQPVDERRNINRSLKICGFSSSRSTPTFPLSPSSPSSPSTKTLPLLELETIPLSPPATPLALIDTKCLLPSAISDSHFVAPPLSTASSSDLLPRRQPLRSPDDRFTPTWVRGQGLEKEGYCSLCENENEGRRGKWLTLKDGSYWYHRTFVHGISSISGQSFAKPLESRCVSNDEHGLSTLEGLCGTCSSWCIFETYRSTPSPSPAKPLEPSRTLWYRHAHSCHSQYPIPRSTSKSSILQTAKPIPSSSSPFISIPLAVA